MSNVTQSAGTGADDASIGTIAWSNPTNIYTDDGNYAVVTINDVGCFLAGTLIYTFNGLIPIEQIAIGYELLGFNEQLEYIPVIVTDIKKLIVSKYCELNTEQLKVFTTYDHPFLTDNWNFFPPVELADKKVTTIFGKETVKIVEHLFETEVYNLSVSGTHTYIANGFYVHNK